MVENFFATTFFWILVSILLLIAGILVIIYFKSMNRFRNGLVHKIHMPDNTFSTNRYDRIPVDNKIIVKEYDSKGEESSFVYFIEAEAIEKGKWGKYIEHDYHNAKPIIPKNRNTSFLMKDLQELYKLIGGFLDTDLHIKLLRNSKFENFMKVMITLILIGVVCGDAFALTNMIKTFSIKSSSDKCSLSLQDNSTWQTIYIASHNIPPSMIPTAQNISGIPQRAR